MNVKVGQIWLYSNKKFVISEFFNESGMIFAKLNVLDTDKFSSYPVQYISGNYGWKLIGCVA